MGRYQSGQLGRTVNPLAFAFEGSNPSRPTLKFMPLFNPDKLGLSFVKIFAVLFLALGIVITILLAL